MRLFRDDEGMTTAAMAISLLVALSLVFSMGQVQRVYAVSARTQSIADACSLAALNPVAEYMVVAKACDAVALSLSLGSLAATGLGIAVRCVPPALPASEALLSAGRNLAQARDRFAEKARAGLDRAQRLLPYLAAAQALSVAAHNGSEGESYVAVALLAPGSSAAPSVPDDDRPSSAAATAEDSADDLSDAVEQMERARREAQSAKEDAFFHDCGNAPGYCMQERAQRLAHLPEALNPTFSSVDAWSFSVALRRAQDYYRYRADQEAPADDSVEEQVRSALRGRFYEYAAAKLQQGYVFEGAGQTDMFFPLLPQNTTEMRLTSLYTNEVYPYGDGGSGPVMHAWPGCPEAGGCSQFGSIWQMERDGFATCPTCGFTAESMGDVASASARIENGFEYHYLAVARLAQDYQRALADAEPAADEAKSIVEDVMGRVGEGFAALSGGAGRIHVEPPGSMGAVVLVANVAEGSVAGPFANAFAPDVGALGCRVAVSAATLVADPSGEGESVLASLLDSVAQGQTGAVGAADVALTCWSDMLEAYGRGHDGLIGAVESALGSLPVVGEGLGGWAADRLRDAAAASGLEPANLDALRPVLVNTAHVAARAGDSDALAALLRAKQQATAHPLVGNDPFDAVMGCLEDVAVDRADEALSRLTVAEVQLVPGVGEPLVVTIALPDAVAGGVRDAISDAFAFLRRLHAESGGVRGWE